MKVFNYILKVVESMNFKKGDIVKVIKKDTFGEIIYPVGSVWEVEGSTSVGDIITVYDSRSEEGIAILYGDRVRKINPCKPLFKVGDMVKVKSSTFIDDHSLGNIYRIEDISTGLTSAEGLVYLYTGVNDDYTRLWAYDFNEVELVNDNSGIESVDIIQDIQDIQDKNLRIKELEKELFKEEQRSNKFFEQANKRFEIIQEQFKEIASLKIENKDLRKRNGELRVKKDIGVQRVRELMEENEILKEKLERKKFLKNFLTWE